MWPNGTHPSSIGWQITYDSKLRSIITHLNRRHVWSWLHRSPWQKNKITICHNWSIILHVHRHHVHALWTIHYTGIIPHKTSTSHPPLNIAFISTHCLHYSTMAQRVSQFNGVLGFPALYTLYDVLDMFCFTSVPYISVKLVRKYSLSFSAMVHGYWVKDTSEYWIH